MTEEPSILLTSTRFTTSEITPKEQEEPVTTRQEKVPGFEQEALSKTAVFLIGAGGLGGEIGEGLIRKGIGKLIISDPDSVELSNLNRQRFYPEDLGKNKAICLAKNLRREAVKRTEIIGIPFSFEETLQSRNYFLCDLAVCGVDNNPTRVFVSKFFYPRKIPVVFTAVSRDANNGYIFVQEPGGACFGCAFPQFINDDSYPCPGLPAVKDILKTVAGFVLYGVDSLLMDRNRNWNLRHVFMAGFVPEITRSIKRVKDCPLCGKTRNRLLVV